MRLSIEVTPEEHQRLKALAALQGKSMKEYVLERVLPQGSSPQERRALRKLEAFLEPRMRAAGTDVSVNEIFKAVHRDGQ